MIGEKREGVRGESPQRVRRCEVVGKVVVFGNVGKAAVELGDGVEGRGEGGEGG